MNILKSKSLHLLCIRIIGAIAVLLANIVILKMESSDLAGLFLVAYTIFQISAVVARFGSDIHLVRNYYKQSSETVQDCFNQSVAVSLLIGSILIPITYFIGNVYVQHWSNLSNGGNDHASILLIFILIPLFSAANTVFFIYQARHKTVIQILGINVIQPWAFLAFYLSIKLAAYLDFLLLTPDTIIVASFYASILTYMIISAAFAKKANMKWALISALSKKPLNKILASQLKYASATIGTQLVGWLPFLLASLFLGASFASVFNILQRLAMLSTFISVSINSISAPQFSELSSRSDYRAIKKIFWSNTKKLTSFSCVYLVSLLALVRFSGQIPEDFHAACYIVLLGFFVNCSTSVCGYYYQNASNIYHLNVALYLTVALSPFVTYWLLGAWGTLGAAVAIGSTIACVNAILFPLATIDLNRRASTKAIRSIQS
jgi:O-antigen/teichoic acid export membrane protein